MATRRTYLHKPAYIYLHTGDSNQKDSASDTQFEFEESEVWDNDTDPNETQLSFPSRSKNPMIPASKRAPRRGPPAAAVDRRPLGSSSSLPVRVPDWSKISRERRGAAEDGGDEGDEDSEVRIPPHEYLARTRKASLSVHEGNGRTLKGRDLRRVRNAIWEQTGFED